MPDPDDKINTDSTWESPPRRQWMFKVFASLALFSFLVGMMIGRLLNPSPEFQRSNSIEQLQVYADGLGVCLVRATQVQEQFEQGAYQLLLLNSIGRSAQGTFYLETPEPVRWRVEQQADNVRIRFVGLHAVTGQWQERTRDSQWCADIQVRAKHTRTK